MTKDPDSLDAFVGSRVGHRRIALGIPRHQIATRLGITNQELDEYELGNRRIGSQRLFQIAQALQVDINFFFNRLLGLTSMDPEASPGSAVLRQ